MLWETVGAVSAPPDRDEAHQDVSADWTVMVYVAGENSLADFVAGDLAEMAAAVGAGAVNVVVQVDTVGEEPSARYVVDASGRVVLVATCRETDSGDPATLREFVEWASATYRATRYALVLWSHGSGWQQDEVDQRVRDDPERYQQEIQRGGMVGDALGRVFFRSSIARILDLPAPRDRATCYDDGSGHSIDSIELGHVLGDVTGALGRPLDILGLDACYMSNLELAYEVRKSARFLVASPASEPAKGWPYDRVLTGLRSNPDLPTEQAAAMIVSEYAAAHRDAGCVSPVTQVALDLGGLPAVVRALDELVAGVVRDMAGSLDCLWRARQHATNFYNGRLCDLLQFCQGVQREAAGTDLAERAGAVCEVLQQVGLDRVVVARELFDPQGSGPMRDLVGAVADGAQNGPGLGTCGGVTANVDLVREAGPFYRELAFARESRWVELLDAYRAADRRSGA